MPSLIKASQEIHPRWEPVQVIAGLRSRRAPGIFGTPQVAVTMAHLMQMASVKPRRREGGQKSMPPCGVALKWPVSFVVGSRRLIIQSRLDSPTRIRAISDPSQSRPLLGQVPSRSNVCGIRALTVAKQDESIIAAAPLAASTGNEHGNRGLPMFLAAYELQLFAARTRDGGSCLAACLPAVTGKQLMACHCEMALYGLKSDLSAYPPQWVCQ